MGDLGFPHSVVRATDPGFQAQIAEVREAGLNIMMSMKGDGKPISFIEDTAVPLEDLADYTERLNAVFERNGARGTWYAHASVGCLHVRPVLNMKDPADVTRMRVDRRGMFRSRPPVQGLAQRRARRRHRPERIQRADVRRAHRPRLRGGEGRVRPRGPCSIPAGSSARRASTTGRCSATGPAIGRLRAFRLSSTGRTFRGRWAASWARSRCATTTASAVNSTPARCVRAIARRATSSISFAAEPTRSGSPSPGSLARRGWPRDDVAEALKLCVSCKACRRECPTGVDMAKMKIEATAALAAQHGMA